MKEKKDLEYSKNITGLSNLTANVESLEAEIGSSSERVSKNEVNKKNQNIRVSKKFNYDDLKEHSKVAVEVRELLFSSLKLIKEIKFYKDGFLDKNEGVVFIFLSFIYLILTPIIFSGDNFKINLIISMIILIISLAFKIMKWNKRKQEKLELLNTFNELRKKLNRNINQVQTYIALSHNSMYRRTFDPILYKSFRAELEKSNVSIENINEIKESLWKDFFKELDKSFIN